MKKHFIDIADFSKDDLLDLIHQAIAFRSHKAPPLDASRICALLFLENSTRTLCSFQIACCRLGIHALYPPPERSSLSKGEGLEDMVLSLHAMGVDALVLRHQDDRICETLKYSVGDQISIINAGNGTVHHPSQTLLDLMTIFEKKQTLTGLNVAIVGDVKHSRVARSLIQGLNIVGDNRISLITPAEWMPDTTDMENVAHSANLKEGLQHADVVVMLRVQKERIAEWDEQLIADYHQNWGLNVTTLDFAAEDAIVMHPGPVNRDMEIASELISHPRSCILHQVSCGVLCRMAILNYVFS